MHRWFSPGVLKKLSLLHGIEAVTINPTSTMAIHTLPLPLNTSVEPRRKLWLEQFKPAAATTTVPAPSRLIGTGTCYQKRVDPNAEQDDWVPMAKGDKVVKVRVATTRLDTILKAGLQISKNKIMKAFYDDRIRVNGERPRKKSQQLAEGDEVDLIRCQNKINPQFLDVARVEVVTVNEEGMGNNDEEETYASDDEESSETKIPVVLKRYKSLTIENYADEWKGSVEGS